MTEAKPAILLVNPSVDRISASVQGNYTIERLWEYPSHEAFLDGPGRAMGAIVTMSGVTPPNTFLARMPNLKLIACATTGFEGIDIDWCRAHGVAVTTGAAVNGYDVADMALGLLISAYRGVASGDRTVRGGNWTGGPGKMLGRSLKGKKVGIVGLGRIGRQIADRCTAFEMVVSWTGPNPKPNVPYSRADSLLELAGASDVLIIAAPASSATEKLIDRPVIDALGAQGVIINIARGALIDEAELIAALREGRLMAAGLDVFEQEPTQAEHWRNLDNVTLTPHVAGATMEGGRAMIDLLAENLRRFHAGEALVSPLF